MGYRTDFNLVDYNDEFKKGIQFIKTLDEETKEFFYLLSELFSEEYTNMKAYDWEEQCIAFAQLFPNAVCEVECSGEESDDLWKFRISDGVVERCEAEIVYSDFHKVDSGSKHIKEITSKIKLINFAEKT